MADVEDPACVGAHVVAGRFLDSATDTICASTGVWSMRSSRKLAAR